MANNISTISKKNTKMAAILEIYVRMTNVHIHTKYDDNFTPRTNHDHDQELIENWHLLPINCNC